MKSSFQGHEENAFQRQGRVNDQSALLEDSLLAHLPHVGVDGASAVLLAAFLGHSWAPTQASLQASDLAPLLRRLGASFANSCGALKQGGQRSSACFSLDVDRFHAISS